MRIAVIAALQLLWVGAAQAQQVAMAAASGQRLQLIHTGLVNPDCSSAGKVYLKVSKSPEHGRIMRFSGSFFPTFPASNVRSHCNTRRVSGVGLSYVSSRGYTGIDTVSIERISERGNLRIFHYTIHVR